MVTIRRVITRQKEFASIYDSKTRKKLLEAFINKMMEINSRRAAQGDVPLSYKEVLEQSKEYLETPSDYVQAVTNNIANTVANNSKKQEFTKKVGGRENGPKRLKPTDFWELVKNIKIDGRDICIDYNKLEGCKENRCSKMHKCAYMERGETKRVCEGRHSKVKHHELKGK